MLTPKIDIPKFFESMRNRTVGAGEAENKREGNKQKPNKEAKLFTGEKQGVHHNHLSR